MELKEFIKTAITDITNAVSELQEELDNGAVLNPILDKGSNGIVINSEVREVQRLDFDIAVTATETTDVGGKAMTGISVFGAKIGAGNETSTENVSRLTFSIPIVLPSTSVKSGFERERPKRPIPPPQDSTGHRGH